MNKKSLRVKGTIMSPEIPKVITIEVINLARSLRIKNSKTSLRPVSKNLNQVKLYQAWVILDKKLIQSI